MADFINRRDLDFLLFELLDVAALCEHPRHAEHDRASLDAVLDAAHAIARGHFAPLAARMDREEPEFDGHGVRLAPEVKAALAAYVDAGFMALGFDRDLGGLQLPTTVARTAGAIFAAANVSLSAYPALATAAARLLATHGSEEQKAAYLPHMLAGRYFGTMCLSEPHAGSSLADIRTRAEPAEGGHYLVTGTKMWISAGDHDLGENIVHLVLAKVPGGPPGVKGISLFIVPKYRLRGDGSRGDHNDVTLAGLNHKMGCRGTTNAVLSFGDRGDCHGYLMGPLHAGLACMFDMMNEIRVGVGFGAAVLGTCGYLHALEYARSRRQGRHPQDKDPASPPVALIEHADIKRLLLVQKSYVEGATALVLYCARLIDERQLARDQEVKRSLGLLLEILTPIAKSWPSEFCLEANKHAIQVLGGYGYTRDHPVERLYRDNRLNLIHEGAHGIHGIDLLGRKVRIHGGEAFRLLVARIAATIAEARTSAATRDFAAMLEAAVSTCVAVTRELVSCADLNRSLANATPYLDSTGTIVVAWMWLKQALAAAAGQQRASDADLPFYAGKLSACRFFLTYELPQAVLQLQVLGSLDDTALRMPAEAYTGS